MTPILFRGFHIGCKVRIKIRTVYEIITDSTVKGVLCGRDQDCMHDVKYVHGKQNTNVYVCGVIVTIS